MTAARTRQQSPPLPPGIRSRFVNGVNELTMHVLEAGFEEPSRPCVLLLHGFPELAFSWRKVMLPIAAAGYHVVAPDQRGYGRTTGWDGRYDGDVGSFRLLNIVRDALALVSALGYRDVASVIGHDFGSPVAAFAALARGDVFRSAIMMSAPFAGPPRLPFDTEARQDRAQTQDIHADLTSLTPPRRHYQWYYSTPEANVDMAECAEGVNAFLRAYYHHKSADWAGNKPFPLKAWAAEELARMPTYYIMEKARTMAETVAVERPSVDEIAACHWLTEPELDVYASNFSSTGFQGGLNWYRCMTDPAHAADLQLFSGRTIDVPACFIAGRSDWGVYQKPGDFERMQREACTAMKGCHLIDGAGHWVQQEQPKEVSRLIVDFLRNHAG